MVMRRGSFAITGFVLLILSFIMIEFSGYGYLDIISQIRTVEYTANQAGTLELAASTPVLEVLIRTILTLTPLLTPGFTLFSVIGLLKVIRGRNPMWLVIINFRAGGCTLAGVRRAQIHYYRVPCLGFLFCRRV